MLKYLVTILTSSIASSLLERVVLTLIPDWHFVRGEVSIEVDGDYG
jgi:hypothetical protein